MSKARYGYGWVLQFVLAAILLGVGIYMAFADEVVYAITGVTIVVFSLFRVYPLLKSLNKEILRTLNLIEIIFDTLIGIMLIYIAVTYKDTLSDQRVWSQVYRFSLVFFLYARGLIYFNSVVFLGEKTEVPKFWMHIIVLSLGAVIATYPDFGYKMVGMLFLIISLIGSVYLGYTGFGGYSKYREHAKELNEGDVKSKKKKKEAPQPVIEDPEEKRPYVN